MKQPYLFTSDRLGFRNWTDSDLPAMTAISADAEVMEFFPAPASSSETEAFIEKMKTSFRDKGYCYFAVEILQEGILIGFIGLSDKLFEAEFTPCVDIGWRLGKAFWGKGYATEGAKACLEYGFTTLKLQNIKAIAPVMNVKSIQVMEKIGMKKQVEFKHPALTTHQRLANCVCYQIENRISQKKSKILFTQIDPTILTL